jgi:hypothetical protein
MRQGQQNRRGRGRGRKGQNPLSRNYESNGPDVKIRGTAQHVAEKYLALARDAIGSGDLVLGENYLQHAEHYNRIIMAAQAQMQASYEQTNGNGPRGTRFDSDGQPGAEGQSDGGFDGDDEFDADQPGDPMAPFDPPRSIEPQQPRGFYQPSRGYQQYRGDFNREGYRNGGQHSRNGGEQPRSFEPPAGNERGQPVDGSRGDQPGGFEQPRFAPEGGEGRQHGEPRQNVHGQQRDGQRGRRRRGRHDNGGGRPYPPQVHQLNNPNGGPPTDAPTAPREQQPTSTREGGDGDGGNFEEPV